MRAEEITEITLLRGPCLGTCPVFSFTATRHRGFEYEGIRYVDPLGTHSGGLPGFLFDRLAELCLELRFFELDDDYPSHFDDAPSVNVRVRHQNGEKIVNYDGGDSEPLRLWAIAALIEVTMREAFQFDDLGRQRRKR